MNEKAESFKNRLKIALEYREMRAVDLSNKTNISQSTISQYLSGYAEPKKKRLQLIADALNVDPTWLMGLNVPMERSLGKYTDYITPDTIAFEITGRRLQNSPKVFDIICKSLDEICKECDAGYTNGVDTFYKVSDMLKSPNISYDDKASSLRAVIDMILYNVKENSYEFFYTAHKNSIDLKTEKLYSIINRLNETGLNKIIDYATDLSRMECYSSSHPKNDLEQIHLMPNAANTRTDICIPENTDTSDNDIMDSEKF